MQDKVTRLRQLLSESIPLNATTSPVELAASRAFQLYELNTAPALVIVQTPRARNEREIERIAAWYAWTGEIFRALDRAGVTMLCELDDEGVEQLVARMRRLEECAQEGLDPPDAPPAR